MEIDACVSVVDRTFVNCRIILHSPASFRNATFTNSVFDFDFPSRKPNMPLQYLARAILNSGFNNAVKV